MEGEKWCQVWCVWKRSEVTGRKTVGLGKGAEVRGIEEKVVSSVVHLRDEWGIVLHRDGESKRLESRESWLGIQGE